MPQSIEFQKQMLETVYINLPGPSEPTPGMTGGELLHGFLAEIYAAQNTETRALVRGLCQKWNVVYRQGQG
jgi:hypothetical protein